MPPTYPLPWIQPTPVHPLSADASLENKGAHPGQRQFPEPEDLLNPAATRMPWDLHRPRQDSLQHYELSQNQYPGPPPPYPMPSAYAPHITAQQFHHLHGLSQSPVISRSPIFAPHQANRQGTPARFPFAGHSPIQQLEPRLTNDGLLQQTQLQPPVTGFNVSQIPEPVHPEQPELDNIVVAQKNKVVMQQGRELPPWPQTPGTILQLGRHCADVRELHRRANMQLQASPPAQPTAQQQMPPSVEALELSAVQGGASPEPTFVENLTTLAENIPPTTERPASTDGEDGEDGLQQTPPKEHANAAEIDLAILMELQGRERNPRRQATAKYREPTTPKPAKRKPNEVAIVKLPTPQNNKRPKRSSTGEARPPPQKKQRTSSAPSVSDNDTANSAPSVSDNDTTRTNGAPSVHGHGTRIDVPITTIQVAHQQVPGEVRLMFIESRPERDVEGDRKFVQDVLEVLEPQTKRKTPDMGRRQAIRISTLLKQAEHPTEEEAKFLTKQDAAEAVSRDNFFRGVIVTHDQQILPLQTIEEFLGEYYEDNADVWIQDPSVRPTKNAQIVHKVKMKAVKQRFTSNNKPHPQPWNCLELATHSDDGLRPMFLNQEECRLLTKLKIPDAADAARRRVYEPGFKEVEKWALLAQAGALTEPHQDSHGYSTYITVNVGLIGFGWLSLPTEQERADWRAQPADYTGGNWRYVVLKPGQTVYFPAGTVHFVFRLPAAGNTLAFGGHVLRCSNLVHWVNTLIEERDSKDVTNEDLTDSATGYLNRVERFVKQAVADGKTGKWGGEANIEEFLRLKAEFESVRQK